MKAASMALAVALVAAAPSYAQMPSLGSLGGSGSSMPGAGGLMGGLAPNVSSMGAGNAAGVLSYCIKNNYLGANGAAGVMSRLQGQTGVPSSSAFSAGQSGQLQLGSGSTLSMDSLKGQMKTRVCDMVLSHSKSLI